MATSSASYKEEPAGLFAKRGSKLHAKMLSKEAAAPLAAPSFRVYYSVASAGAVPFLWESQPGTPKNDPRSNAALPPLTPPPSYYSSAGGRKGGGGGQSKKRRGAAAFFAFLRRPGRSTSTTPCSASSSSSWSTSSSSSSAMSPVFAVQQQSPSPAAHGRHGRTFSADADEARFFGVEHDECCGERGIVKGCSVVGAVRNVLASVVGSGGRRATPAA